MKDTCMFQERTQNRRDFLGVAAATTVATAIGFIGTSRAASERAEQSSLVSAPIRQLRAGVLDVGYYEVGPCDGHPVLLLHGFPYSIDSYVKVAPMLAAVAAG